MPKVQAVLKALHLMIRRGCWAGFTGLLRIYRTYLVNPGKILSILSIARSELTHPDL